MAYLSRVSRGDPITADAYNSLVDEVVRLGKLSGAAPIEVSHLPGGPVVRLVADDDWGEGQLTSTLARGTIGTPTSATMLLYQQNADGSYTLGSTSETVLDVGYLPAASLTTSTNIRWKRKGAHRYYDGGGCNS